MQEPNKLKLEINENEVTIKEEQDIKENDDIIDDFEFDDYDYGSSTEKYGGYNGFSDDVIDDAFEGDLEATWNVD